MTLKDARLSAALRSTRDRRPVAVMNWAGTFEPMVWGGGLNARDVPADAVAMFVNGYDVLDPGRGEWRAS